MAKNYMQDVAKMLGVELEEEFMIDSSDKVYRFFKNGLCFQCDGAWLPAEYQFFDLIKGECKIIKLPWQPKKGEKYYTPSPDFNHAFCDYWDGYPSDFALKEAGMAFKTKEECEATLPVLRKKYLGE